MAKVEGGVRVFPNRSFEESEETNAQLRKIIEDAREIGCVDSLRRHNHNVGYLTDPRRSKYLDYIGIRDDDDVLEIGSSMGQHTRLIAARARSVNALEVVELQARFARLWCDEERLGNVEVSCGGADGTLPYADESFDLITMNYVLEWCAGRSEVDPHEFHRRYLRDVVRVLRPGGRFFISTKNRFALKYLTGGRDEHLGARFGSALPRILQDRIRANARLEHPTGYLHSWNGLRDTLLGAGFSAVRPVLCFPDARFPSFIGDIADFSPREAARSAGRKDRMFLRLPKGLQRQLSSSIVFLVTR